MIESDSAVFSFRILLVSAISMRFIYICMLAEDACERRFVLECKRLGKPTSSSWILNENYVQNGIHRFVTSPHEYGKGDDTGGMVGYIQSMELNEILEEVNAAARNSSAPTLELTLSSDGWKENGVSELEHELTRNFPISVFFLHHFWVDLRNSYPQK